MKRWLKSKRNCLIMALLVNTLAIAVAYGIVQLLVKPSAVTYILWSCMYPIITVALYKYFRWVGNNGGRQKETQ